MHAWVSYTSADTHGCRLHQEPLDLLPGVFQVHTLRHKLQRLERVIFVRSLLYLHSCPKQAPCSSLCGFEVLTLKVDFKWFETTTKLMRRDAFSANISLPSFHKNWSLIGREKLHCWYWKNRAMSVKFCIEGSCLASSSKTGSIGVRLCLEALHCQSLVVERWPWGVRQITRCRRGGQRWVNPFGSDRRLHRGNGRLELTKFESICLRKQQRQPWLLDSIIFHTIPRACAVMECIQWVAWTFSVWTFVSPSWCLHAFGRSKSSDAMPRAKESMEFDSTFQGTHSFETSPSSYTKKVSVPGRSLAASNSRCEGKWYELYAGACILYGYSSLHSFHDQRLKMGAKWSAFLGVNAWSDNIEGWILSHFTLARCGRTNSCAAYVLAFTGKSNIKCLNVPYKFLHWWFSSLLNSENCLHLTM